MQRRRGAPPRSRARKRDLCALSERAALRGLHIHGGRLSAGRRHGRAEQEGEGRGEGQGRQGQGHQAPGQHEPSGALFVLCLYLWLYTVSTFLQAGSLHRDREADTALVNELQGQQCVACQQGSY